MNDFVNREEKPGEYVVARGHQRGEYEAFHKWDDKKPVIGDVGHAMVFTYKGMAENVAEQLGEEWYVVDISYEQYIKQKRFLNAIFGEEQP